MGFPNVQKKPPKSKDKGGKINCIEIQYINYKGIHIMALICNLTINREVLAKTKKRPIT